jgi:CubicO group peptidase (beta-lactamase class C family)
MRSFELSKGRIDRLHEVMAARVERGNLPGLVTVVADKTAVRFDPIGVKTVGTSDQMTRDSIFRVASLTKPIVAAAAMSLAEEGKVRLDEPVDGLLPELADRRVLKSVDGPIEDTVKAHRSITVRDLLTCRMGFGIIWGPPDAHPIQRTAQELHLGAFGPPHPQEPPPPDEWIRRFSTLPLMYQPGERWAYNTAFEVSGVLIARASGQSLGALLQERIFAPLGMKDTGFSVPPECLARLATSYAADPATGALEPYDSVKASAWSRPPAFPSAAGGLVSTADDVLAFGQMMLRCGEYRGARILSAESVREMTTEQLTDEQKAASPMAPAPTYWQNHGWGLGLAVTTGDGAPTAAGAFGWEGGLGTSWASDPRHGMVAILLTQYGASTAFSDVHRDFWRAAYEGIV